MKDSVTMRRQLRGELRRYRTDLRLTQRQVANDLEWSSSKVIRIENGSVAVSVTDLRALLQRYGIADPTTIEELAELARGSRQMPFSAYRESINAEALRYFAYESAASYVHQAQPLLVPGLLQVKEYTRALLTSWGNEKKVVDDIWNARVERQEVFDRATPPECDFVIDEAVVRRQVGGPEVMRRQLGHMVAMSERENVSVRVVPFESGGYLALQGPFTVLEFDGDDEPVLYLERPQGDAVFRDDADVTGRYLDVFSEYERRTDTVDIATFVAKL